jgi:hypothetical protein
MASDDSTATEPGQTCSIPRYIQSLNTVAARAGLTSSLTTQKKDSDEFIQGIWRGTRAQFKKTHLLTSKYRFPLTMGRIWTSYGLHGDMLKVGDGYELLFEYAQPERIEAENDLEILHYSPTNTFDRDGDKCVHGTMKDLLVTGTITKADLPRRGSNVKDNSNIRTGDRRKTRRLPDGTLLLSTKKEEPCLPEKRGFQTAEEYRHRLLENVILAYCAQTSVETKTNTQVYTVDEESKESIDDAWRNVYSATHNAVIHTSSRNAVIPTSKVRLELTLIENHEAVAARVVQPQLRLVRSEDALH